jgi:hypothetical protein
MMIRQVIGEKQYKLSKLSNVENIEVYPINEYHLNQNYLILRTLLNSLGKK